MSGFYCSACCLTLRGGVNPLKPAHLAVFMAIFLFVYSFVRSTDVDWVGRIISPLVGAVVAYVVFALLQRFFLNR